MKTDSGILIQPGDIAAVRMFRQHRARLIRAGEFLNGDGIGDFEHAICYVGNGMILEAEPGGARIVPNHYQPDDCLWSTGKTSLALTDAQRAYALVTARTFQGIGYSALDYGALALHRLNIPAPHLREFIASTGHMICSQLADEFRADLGSKLFADGRWPGFVTPADLANLIRAAG